MSRFAAVAGLALFIFERIAMVSQGFSFSSIFIAVAIILGFVNAIRGTYAYQKFKKA